MTKKVLTSFGFGEHSEMLSIASRSFYKYAMIHNYDCFFPSENFFSEETKKYPYSWWKIECITKLLENYDIVLWVDSDVIICDPVKDMANELSQDVHMGLVVHDVPIGKIPNCGIWILNKKSLSWINDVWKHNTFHRSDGWWEQAAVMHLLGFNPDQDIVSVPEKFNIPFEQLDYRWNPHVHDYRGLPQDLYFLHFTMIADRVSSMKKVSAQIGLM